VALTVAKLLRLCILFKYLGLPFSIPPTLGCDKIGALSLASNLVFHVCTKYIEMDYHFIREKVFRKDFLNRYISTLDQPVDFF